VYKSFVKRRTMEKSSKTILRTSMARVVSYSDSPPRIHLVETMHANMNHDLCMDGWVDQKVTYVVEVEGRVSIVENVPAKVCLETGERLYAAETVERLQQMI